MFRRGHAVYLGVPLVLSFALSACSDEVDSCEETRSCTTSGDGDGETDTDSGSGGASPGSGGSTGDGDGDETDTEDSGGGTGDGDGDICLPATCPNGYCEGGDCVECVHGDSSKECQSNELPVCLEDNTCAECASNADCTDEAFSVCDEASHECVPCTDDDGCSHLDTTHLCDTEASVCIECTIDTEVDKCGAHSCDPATNTCTETDRASVGNCQPCVADSECIPNHHCVPMDYKGEARGGYCLLKVTNANCVRPFEIPLEDRSTLSDVTGEDYCGINEALTTCEAVLALQNADTCPNGDECPEGGLCRTVGASANRCTYECSNASHCLPEADAPKNVCKYGPATGGSSGTGGGEGTGGQKYCGGTVD